MTTDEIKAYYANLLIIQYHGLAKAVATVSHLAGMQIMDQLPAAVRDAYDIDTAVGAQLDVLGKYIGVSRSGYTFSGPVVLDDDDYRQVLSLGIVLNYSGSSLADIQSLLNQFFPGIILVSDYKNMHMSYLIDTDETGSDLAEFFVKQNLLPQPMGVSLSVAGGTKIKKFFGLRTYAYNSTSYNSPLNTYADYQTDRPFMSYANSIAP